MDYIAHLLKGRFKGKFYDFLKKIYGLLHPIYYRFVGLFYYVFRLFPLQNKIIATTFRGRKYGDNSRFIVEELHRINPELEIVWIGRHESNYELPSYIRKIDYYAQIKKAYELATAKVWVNTHRMEHNIRKRKGQLFIETWHGGLGIKKIEGDVPTVIERDWEAAEIRNTAKMADLFISNSDHLTNIYRSAFGYEGKIWKSGYPKNDILFSPAEPFKKKILDTYGLEQNTRLLIYAPTFRDYFDVSGIKLDPYRIDFDRLHSALEKKTGEKWIILIRWHPVMVTKMEHAEEIYGENVIDCTSYPEMQELILAADAFISDYSSCIFDAAIREMPCFTFATDFEEYKSDRGVYYEMEELPFPYAKNNEELIQNIEHFNYDEYLQKWNAFRARTGLKETGHAAKDIAFVIDGFVKGNLSPLEEIQSE